MIFPIIMIVICAVLGGGAFLFIKNEAASAAACESEVLR